MTGTVTKESTTLEPVLEGLYASQSQTLPFATSLEVRAFLLRRDRGNLLVYSVPGLAREAAAFAELGGVSRQYLNHGHEAMFASDRMDVPLFVHEDDRGSVDSRAHLRATFSRRHVLDDDFEVIPTPGHTPGATAFLWEGGGRRFLFTGDTIYLSEGEWSAAVLDSSDRTAYLESLELMRDLDFDVLVPWAATGGQLPYAATGQAEARRRIEAVIERVRSGGDR
jgi:glyoxylase-like metal-dependent hydrolase (beta-lactamase superfamily II)